MAGISDEIEAEEWRKAAKHEAGKGLEQGRPSFEAWRAVKKVLAKSNQPAFALALDAVVAGGAIVA